MEEVKEKINWEIRRRSQILDAEGTMVDLLNRKTAFRSSLIPTGYKAQWESFWFSTGSNLPIPTKISSGTFRLFYDWLREVGREEPEL